MAVNVETTERIVATAGQIKLASIPDAELNYPEQLHNRMFRVTAQMHGVESFVVTIGLSQLRDLFDVLGDLITYLDTAQPDAAPLVQAS